MSTLSWALFPAIALALTLPFAFRGYHGDDSQFHFDSWIAMHQAWKVGNFAPGWDALANFKLGDPRFSFYPPISIWFGALLCVILPFKLVPAAFIWIALVLSAVCMYTASRPIVGAKLGMWAALLYMLSPYLLVTAITRFAVAELLVLAWLPLIISHFLRATLDLDRRSFLILCALLGLTWLTNLPASIVLIYVLLPAAGITALRLRSFRPALFMCLAEGLGVMAASYPLVPAFFERKWITTSALLHQDFRDYFLFYSASGFHRAHFLLGLWVIAGVESALILTAAILWKSANGYQRSVYELAAVSFLFQIPVTAILWVYAPMLRFVQFPFRFLAITGTILPIVLLGNGVNRRFAQAAFAVVILLACFPVVFYLRISPKTPSALPDPSSVERAGHPGTDEYTPAGAITRMAPISLPQAAPAAGSSSSRCGVSVTPGDARIQQIAVEASRECSVQLATYFYPYWQATDESGNRLQTSRSGTGQLVVLVPPGRHAVQLQFRSDSKLRRLSAALSMAAVVFLAMGLLNEFRAGSRKPDAEQTVSSNASQEVQVPVMAPMIQHLNPATSESRG